MVLKSEKKLLVCLQAWTFPGEVASMLSKRGMSCCCRLLRLLFLFCFLVFFFYFFFFFFLLLLLLPVIFLLLYSFSSSFSPITVIVVISFKRFLGRQRRRPAKCQLHRYPEWYRYLMSAHTPLLYHLLLLWQLHQCFLHPRFFLYY